MEQTEIEIQFVERTLSIIERYNESDKDKQYEKTLLVNCLLGLIVAPNTIVKERGQSLQKFIPNPPSKESLGWDINPNHIKLMKCWDWKTGSFVDEDMNLKHVIRHIRNAVAHFHIKLHSDNKEITKVEFWDIDEYHKKGKTFKAVMPIGNLETFAKELGNSYVLWYKNKKAGQYKQQP